MAKRRAGCDLTRDNWDRDEEPEEEVMGVGFQRASDEVLAGRKIKVARRRGADAVTTGGSDKPSIFKNFSGFGSMASGGNSAPKFDFGAKKQDEPNNEMKKLFEASSFKPGTSSATSPSFPSFSFTSTSNKENSKPLESNSEPVNGSADSSKKPTGHESDKQAFYEKLKALNEGVLQWIQKHVSENSLINLSPVFDDYKEHFAALEKQFKPKFSKTGSSSTSEGPSSYKNFSFAASSKSTNSTSSKTESVAASPETTKSKPLFSFAASDNKPSESVTSAKETFSSKPAFSFSSSPSTSTSTTGELKPKESAPLFSFGTSASESKSNESSASGGFSFGAKDSSSSGFSFGGAGGLTFGAKETPAFSGFGSKTTMTFAPVPPAASSESKEDEETETPPKPEVLEVKEENSFYEKKCKLFYKKDGNFVDKGVGTLYLKSVGETKKTQLIMRAATSLGNVLLNIVLNSSLPTQRMGKNNVLIVCVPNPPLDTKDAADKPVTMLIRVKTAEDADELYKKINENKGE